MYYHRYWLVNKNMGNGWRYMCKHSRIRTTNRRIASTSKTETRSHPREIGIACGASDSETNLQFDMKQIQLPIRKIQIYSVRSGKNLSNDETRQWYGCVVCVEHIVERMREDEKYAMREHTRDRLLLKQTRLYSIRFSFHFFGFVRSWFAARQ